MRKNYLKQICCFLIKTEADGLKYPMFVYKTINFLFQVIFLTDILRMH